MFRRILGVALVATSVAAIAMAVPAAQAKPATQSTTCDANILLSFKPGLLYSSRNQTIRAKGTLSNCAGGGVTSATGKGSGSGNMSCTSGSGSATVSLTWNTAERSQITITVDANGTVTGTVTRGKFAGESVTASLTVTPQNGDCVFTPVTKATATGSVSL